MHVTVYSGKSFSRIRKENRKIQLYSKTNDVSWIREKLKMIRIKLEIYSEKALEVLTTNELRTESSL